MQNVKFDGNLTTLKEAMFMSLKFPWKTLHTFVQF